MMRNLKPKIKCLSCDKNAIARGYCGACHARALRQGLLQKLIPKELPDKLTKIQEEVLIGSMLGDGCLFKYKQTNNPYFTVGRQLKDKVYAQWEEEIFKPLICKSVDGEVFDKRTNKVYKFTKFRTHHAKVFNDYYDKWYPSGVKIIPNDIIFTPLILAVWFADDGFIRCGKSSHRMRLSFSTQGFKVSEVEVLVEMLCKRYNEKFTIEFSNGKPKINASDNATRTFLKEIDFYFPPGLDRKAYWRKVEARFYENEPPKTFTIKKKE